jgi:RNA recognition motif. (a.k.a. RRM, RBD, or RNP domain)
VEIPTGEGRFRPLQLLLPSSKRKSDTWDSRSKHVPVQWRYGIGASGIRTGATYRNGCLRSGESLWSHTSVARRDPPIKPALLALDWPSARNIRVVPDILPRHLIANSGFPGLALLPCRHPGKNIYVGNLGSSTSEEALRQLFAGVSDMSDLKVRLHGNTAVVTGAYHEKGTEKGKPYEYHGRYLEQQLSPTLSKSQSTKVTPKEAKSC